MKICARLKHVKKRLGNFFLEEECMRLLQCIFVMSILIIIGIIFGSGCLDNEIVSLPQESITLTRDSILGEHVLLTDYQHGVYTSDGELVSNASVTDNGRIVITNNGKAEVLSNLMLNQKTGEIVHILRFLFDQESLQLFYDAEGYPYLGNLKNDFISTIINGEVIDHDLFLGAEIGQELVNREDMISRGITDRDKLITYLAEHGLVNRDDYRLIFDSNARPLIADLVNREDYAPTNIDITYEVEINTTDFVTYGNGESNKFMKLRERDEGTTFNFDSLFEVGGVIAILDETGTFGEPLYSKCALLGKPDRFTRLYKCSMTYTAETQQSRIVSMGVALKARKTIGKVLDKNDLLFQGQVEFQHDEGEVIPLKRILDTTCDLGKLYRQQLSYTPQYTLLQSFLIDFDARELLHPFDKNLDKIIDSFQDISLDYNGARINIIQNYRER